MIILNPLKNITSIISLIENAKEFVVIVSPYSDLTGWDKLKNAINQMMKLHNESFSEIYYFPFDKTETCLRHTMIVIPAIIINEQRTCPMLIKPRTKPS